MWTGRMANPCLNDLNLVSDKHEDPVCEQEDNCNTSYLDNTQGDPEWKEQELYKLPVTPDNNCNISF